MTRMTLTALGYAGGRVRAHASWGMAIVVAIVFLAIAAPILAPYDPDRQFLGVQLLPAWSPGHLLGTDELSRDILSRVLYGTRVSVGVGVASVLVGAALGIVAGVVAATSVPVVDTLIMRSCDFVLALPGVLLGIVVVSLMGAGLVQVSLAIAVINIPVFARLMRAGALREKDLVYIRAARAQGAGYGRILFRHILPNALPPAVTQISPAIGQAILLEAGLSFLGLGVQPPTASWGAMLSKSRDYLGIAPLYAFVPGLLLFLFILGLNKLSETADDA